MAENDIGSVVVMDHGELIGIPTFREVINTLNRYGEQFGGHKVRNLMVQGPLTVGPDTDISEVRRVMLEQHARYLPVMDGRTLTGVISFYDVARAVYEEQSFENRMLKAYIRDWPEQESVNG
jgi:CBS domain-containing protein